MPRHEFREEDMYSQEDGREKCKAEILGFLKGGEGAVQRLKEILPTLFAYYRLITTDSQAGLLLECHLTPYRDQTKGDVTFFFQGADVRDQFRPPASMKHDWTYLVTPRKDENPTKVSQETSQPSQKDNEVPSLFCVISNCWIQDFHL